MNEAIATVRLKLTEEGRVKGLKGYLLIDYVNEHDPQTEHPKDRCFRDLARVGCVVQVNGRETDLQGAIAEAYSLRHRRGV